MKIILQAIFIVFLFLIFFQQLNAQKLAFVPYACCTTGDESVDIKHCGDDRLFVLDRGGVIQVINADGTLRPTPFLDITSKIFQGSDEETLVGMAFSPNYKSNGKFYVYYVGDSIGLPISIVEQYQVSAADSNIADPSSALKIITQYQPYSIHKAGNMMFGQDGFLYWNLGDGGSPEDSAGYAQNTHTLLGKILRIDVSNSSVAQPYIIPPSNPFYNDNTGIRKEIWASGLRNPWRASIDKITGDRWFTDVGQNTEEEVDYEPVSFSGGNNYGWNIMEGDTCFNPPSGCNKTGLALPTYTYLHPYGQAIMGGYVCRSAQSKSLFGTYIFADFISKWVDGIKQSGGIITDTFHLITGAQNTIGNPLDLAEDRYGDLYVLFLTDKTIYKLEDTSYQRRPKAYYTPVEQGGGTSYLLQGLQGRNLTYQWLKNNVAISGADSPNYTVTDSGIYSLVVTNILGISDTSNVFPFGPLLLNLSSFTAQKTSNNQITLQWKTASEYNITGFNILRKKNDETSFSNIGFVASKSINGFSSNELDYTFIDSSASNYTQIFYRLQIEHADGSFTYSNIVLISSDATKNGYTLFPNPAKGQVQLYLNVYTQPVVMVLYDNTGKKIQQQAITQQSSTINLPASKGVYIIQMSNSDGSNKVRKKLLVD